MAQNKTKMTKLQKIAKLQAELRAYKAEDVYTMRLAYDELAKLTKSRFMASGLILHITDPGGREVLQPVMIKDGFSDSTIAAIQADLKAGLEMRLAFATLPEPKKEGVK